MIEEYECDKLALQELHKEVSKFREAQFKMQEAEERFTYAKNMYNQAVQELAQKLRFNGLESLTTADGLAIKLSTGVRCSIRKDEQSQQEVAEWLRARDMDNLVSSTLTVMPSARSKLDSLHIPYDENLLMNTNSVKAYVKKELESGSLERSDIPKGLSWFEYDDIKVGEV